MSLIYNYLKDKATDPNYMHKPFYANSLSTYRILDYDIMSFLDLYNNVNKYMDYIKNSDFINKKDKPCFMVVSKQFFDISTFIALMELGFKPIPIFGIYLNKEALDTKDYIKECSFDIAPQIKNITGEDIINDQIVIFDDPFVSWKLGVLSVQDKSAFYSVIKECTNIDELDNTDFDFGILTGGTTGKSKILKIKEEDFIHSIIRKYNTVDDETYVCQSPISSISGMLFDVYLPIIGENKRVALGVFEENDKSEINHNINIIVPSNFANYHYGNSHCYTIDRDSKNIHQISLIGTEISNASYKKLKEIHEESDIKIVSYYGRTEQNGLISQLYFSEIKPLYMFYNLIENDSVIIKNDEGSYILKNIDGKSVLEEYNEIPIKDKLCHEIYPIARLDNPYEHIKINEDVFGEIIVNDEKTGDYGIKYNGYIYMVGREEELTEKYGIYAHIRTLEHYLSKRTDGDIEDIKTLNTSNDYRCFIVKNKNGNYNVYFACVVPAVFLSNNYYLNHEYFREEYNLISSLLPIDDMIMCKYNTIDEIFENTKTKRHRLLSLKPVCHYNEINSLDDEVELVKKLMKNKINRSIDIEYDKEYNYYILSKKELNNIEMARIINMFTILDYKEDKDNYYIIVSDDFLFANYVDIYERGENNSSFLEFQSSENTKTLREYVLSKNEIFAEYYFTIKYSYDNNKIFAEVKNISEKEYEENKDIYDGNIYVKTSCNIHHMMKNVFNNAINYGNGTYSIDNDNNFYCNNRKIEFDYRIPEIYNRIYELLLIHKDEINRKEKKLCKT